MERVEIITVHYKTPEYIYEQHRSIRRFYPDTPYRVIDGSDDGCRYFSDLETIDSHFTVERMGYNIHHGPGMDYALRTSHHDYVLILDSDVTLKAPPIASMLEQLRGYAVGKMKMLNAIGIEKWQNRGLARMFPHSYKYPYVHPYCMLIGREAYLRYRPFVKHGSPCLDAAIDLYRRGLTSLLNNVTIEEFVELRFMGTRGKWGLNIPPFISLLPRTLFVRSNS